MTMWYFYHNLRLLSTGRNLPRLRQLYLEWEPYENCSITEVINVDTAPLLNNFQIIQNCVSPRWWSIPISIQATKPVTSLRSIFKRSYTRQKSSV